jgi:hypothetical protein
MWRAKGSYKHKRWIEERKVEIYNKDVHRQRMNKESLG